MKHLRVIDSLKRSYLESEGLVYFTHPIPHIGKYKLPLQSSTGHAHLLVNELKK